MWAHWSNKHHWLPPVKQEIINITNHIKIYSVNRQSLEYLLQFLLHIQSDPTSHRKTNPSNLNFCRMTRENGLNLQPTTLRHNRDLKKINPKNRTILRGGMAYISFFDVEENLTTCNGTFNHIFEVE